MNVAVTRAKRFVCLIGNSETVNKDPFLQNLIKYFSDHGELRNAAMYLNDERVQFKMIEQEP